MKEVPLNKGYVMQIDDENHDHYTQHVWRVTTGDSARNRYAITNVMRNETLGWKGGQVGLMFHRLILGHPSKEFEVDHIDGNSLNNQKSNLRLCTKTQNSYNKKLYLNNASGWKGVRLQAKSGNWIARIRYKTKLIHLGCYATSVEAAQAYNDAAIIFYKEFASLNDLPDGVIPIPIGRTKQNLAVFKALYMLKDTA